MKVPIAWLKEFVPCDLSPQQIADTLTLLGLEVEGILDTPLSFSGVVVGKVLEAHPHPNADRLRVATVTDGTTNYQVVCGAPNCRSGITVAFAKIGASLQDSEGKTWKIKKSKIRDVESEGMLCSEKELGLPETIDGIVELPDSWQLGKDLVEFYSNPVLDIALTANLGHCASVLGIARELAAALNVKARRPTASIREEITARMPVKIENPTLCHHYACRFVEGVEVGPSPEWLQKKLTACGLRPINNVVDVGNYVMWETGQPLHIFDADALEKEMIITDKRPYDKITTLDEKERALPPGTLLICDAKKPLALAGIMGGLSSAATDKTRRIVIEASSFHPSQIRRTARLLDLRSDGSFRHERGTDTAALVLALDRATQLIQEIAGGKAGPVTDVYPQPAPVKQIPLRLARITQILGISLSQSEVVSLLERLEMRVSDSLVVTVPTYRNDINTEIDLIEEIARIFGFNNLPKAPPRHISSPLTDTPMHSLENLIRTLLLELGLQECITCNLLSPTQVDKTTEKLTPISVLHPRALDQSVLRTSLLPGLLEVTRHNFSHQTKNLSGFEIGRIHFQEGETFQEQTCAGIFLTGKKAPHYFDPKPEDFDFFDLKGILENLLSALHMDKARFLPSHLHTLHPNQQAKIEINGVTIGAFGQVHPHLSPTQKVYFAQLNLGDILALKPAKITYESLPTFPGSERDWTLTVQESTPIDVISQAIQSVRPRFLENFYLLDLFRSPQNTDRKNVTLRFFYRDNTKTIELETVEKMHQKLMQAVAEKLANHIV
ncbi:MAG: phenylalanine--tRNA ligase subunit beta [Verrucomicrobia bacterium]|nr:phenylalanine--tRNA ligase subunit beta [Verrucomicrobiota bacterium]